MVYEKKFEEALRPSDPKKRIAKGNDYHWKFDVKTQEWEMPDLQRMFLEEWCLVWPRLMTQREWAEEHDVRVETVTRWKRDPRFENEWKKRADQEHTNPDFYEPVINKLRATILKGSQDELTREQLSSIKLFFSAIKDMNPNMDRESVVKDDALNEIMEEELAGMLQGGANASEEESSS